MLNLMAVAEIIVIIVPGMKLTKSPISRRTKYPTSAKPPIRAVTTMANDEARQIKKAPTTVTPPNQNRFLAC